MQQFRRLKRILAFLMVLVTLAITSSNYPFKKMLIEPLEELASHQTMLAAASADAEGGMKDFKPPKHSFINYETLFSSCLVLPAYRPTFGDLVAYPTSGPPPEVYAEIFIPPETTS